MEWPARRWPGIPGERRLKLGSTTGAQKLSDDRHNIPLFLSQHALFQCVHLATVPVSHKYSPASESLTLRSVIGTRPLPNCYEYDPQTWTPLTPLLTSEFHNPWSLSPQLLEINTPEGIPPWMQRQTNLREARGGHRNQSVQVATPPSNRPLVVLAERYRLE
ncbi:hypothetical protein SCP_0105270 [Sparassis crispa]|uniref:Uncharacterized protein n=1 Tax=Sparassis crispa TaxID=139825 RepID=A0A401G669_9APHY|nr:hypothetical protein SCP_0105270 [Sparassis crispa]GBE77647.1 hypothetical protein SCP_0105270 [Sparassis crispa]